MQRMYRFGLAASVALGVGMAATMAHSSLGPDPKYTADDLHCLALTIYWEARGEPDVGQYAVAHTVLNRARNGAFPDSICGVVRQGGETPVGRCQFSWWCDGRSDDPLDDRSWRKAREVTRAALEGVSIDPTGGAIYFHARDVAPEWAESLQPGAGLGGHLFYLASSEGAEIVR